VRPRPGGGVTIAPGAVRQDAGPPTCPYLLTVGGEQAGLWPGGRVCGRRAGGMRPPSRDELAWFCVSGRFRACPTWREIRCGGTP